MTDQSSSSNAAPSAQPQGATPGSQPAVPPTQQAGSQPAQEQGQAQVPDSQKNNEPAPTFSFGDHLTDDEKAYLKSQGVDSFDAQGIKKLVAHHKQLRSKKQETNQQDSLDTVVQQAVQPAQQPVEGQQPTQGGSFPEQQPQQPVQPQSEQPTQVTPDPFEVATVGMVVKNQYPEVEPTNVIKEMTDLGISILDSNGRLDMQRISKYAGIVNDRVQKEKQLAELTKPAPTSTPDLKPESVDLNAPQVETMDNKSAYAILSWSTQQQKLGKPVHPQLDAAKQFIQSQVK